MTPDLRPLAEWARTQPNRCDRGFALPEQHGPDRLCDCQNAYSKTAIDAAIARWARSGQEFSANDCRRDFPGITGAVVGGRFNAAARAGLIRDTGKRVPSTLGSTHGHEVRVWMGVAA